VKTDCQNEIVALANPHECDHIGNCSACGATREEIDDNLAPYCPRFEGHVHAVALIALNRTITRHRFDIEHEQRRLRSMEDCVAAMANSLRLRERNLRYLIESFVALKAL
jgi:uncharacterized coiled-coil protein SlyX